MITITIVGEHAEVRFPYDPTRNPRIIELVKTIPGRRFHKDARKWTIPAADAAHLEALLDKEGFQAHLLRPASQATPDWVQALTARIACSRRLFLRLVHALHPDTGGDGRLMQELNDGYKRCCGGGR